MSRLLWFVIGGISTVIGTSVAAVLLAENDGSVTDNAERYDYKDDSQIDEEQNITPLKHGAIREKEQHITGLRAYQEQPLTTTDNAENSSTSPIPTTP